jgi:hypothetical protein
VICAIKVLDPEQYVQDFLSTQTDRAGVPYGESKSEYFGQYKLIMTKQEVSERVQLITSRMALCLALASSMHTTTTTTTLAMH